MLKTPMISKAFLPFIILLLLYHCSHAQHDLTAEQVYDIVNESVVMIVSRDNKGNEEQGSGVIILDGTYIVTSYHLFEDTEIITVKHQKMEFSNIEVAAEDRQKDITILKIHDAKLPFLKIGDSDNIRTGQKVYAISSPEGYENTISEGIISGLRKDIAATPMIQTTTPITEGSSGGALVNGRGELIGILTSGQHEGNLYFSVPVNEVMKMQIFSENSTSTASNEDFFMQGLKAAEEGKYSDAINLFSKHLERNSKDELAYFNRGKVYGKLKNYKKEITDYTTALQLDPDFAEAYKFRGTAYRHINKYTEAIRDFSCAIQIQPDDAEALFNRGIVYYYSDQPELAVEDYTRVIELIPEFSNAYYNRGFAYKKMDKSVEAKSDFERAIELNPENEKKLRYVIEELK